MRSPSVAVLALALALHPGWSVAQPQLPGGPATPGPTPSPTGLPTTGPTAVVRSILDSVQPSTGRAATPVDSIELFADAVRTFPWLVARLQNWGLRGGATLIIPSNFAIRDVSHNGIDVDQALLENHIFDGNLTAAVLRTRASVTAWSGATFTIFSTVEAMGGRSMDYISIGNNLSHGILVTTDVGTASGLGVVHSIDRALLSASQMPNTTSTTAIPPGSAGSESETTMTSETIILLAIGALLCLLLVILAGMAVCCRGGSGSSSQPVVVAQQHGYGGPSPVGIYRGQPQQERMQSPHHREPPMSWQPGSSAESLTNPHNEQLVASFDQRPEAGVFRRPSKQYLDIDGRGVSASPPGRQPSATVNAYTGPASIKLRGRPELDSTPKPLSPRQY